MSHSIRLLTLFAVLSTTLYCAEARAEDNDYIVCHDNWRRASYCWNRARSPRWRPIISVALEGGASHFNEDGPADFTHGVGNATTAGGAWGLRVGVDFFSWLGIEVRYLGMYNGVHSNIPAGGGATDYLTTAGIFDVKLTAPIPYVRPYIFAGIGVYNMHLLGSDAAKAESPLTSTTQAGIPMGVGLEIPLNYHLSFAVEAAYHFQLGEDFAKTHMGSIDGGDFSTATGLFRVRL